MSHATEQSTSKALSSADHKIQRLERLLARYKYARTVQSALLQLSELASSVTDMAVFYTAMHGVIGQLLHAENIYVVLVDEDSGRYTPVYFSDEKDQEELEQIDSGYFETGLTGYVYRTRETLVCDQHKLDEMAANGEVQVNGAIPTHWMGTPLVRGRKAFGVIAVQIYGNGFYTETDQELLEFITLHLVTAIDRIKQREWLEQSVRNRTKELSSVNKNLQLQISQRRKVEKLQSALFKISQITATAVLMDDFYCAIHQVLKTLIYAENCYIALLSDDRKSLNFPFYVDARHPRAVSRILGRGLTEYVINEGRACLIDREQTDELVEQGVILRRQNESADQTTMATSWLGAPLVIEKEAIGVVATQAYDNEYEYTEQELEVLCYVSHHLAVAIERKLAADQLRRSHDDLESQVYTRTQELQQSNLFLKLQVEERKKAEEKLYFEANHDALTGLPNRKMILQRLEQAIAHKKRHQDHHFAVLFIDLDRFKIINDTMGHHVGDQFLIEVSIRVSNCVRDNDVVARLGGDEFVILLDMIQSIDDAEDIAQRIITSASSAFYINEQEIYSGASVGIAECKDGYQSADDLLRDADAAMYQAKNMGRGRFIVFDETMHQKLMEELNIDQALHRAVKEDGLIPRFTPLHNIDNGEELGFSVEPHWHHPEMGDMEPEYFASLAQSNGLVETIDQQMLTLICQQMKPYGKLADTGLICVNLSTANLTQNKSVHQLLEIVTDTGIDPHKLCFVFTEQGLLKLPSVSLVGLKKIKQAGIKVSVKGFGSEVSSLGLLTKNHVNYVQVSGDFTRSLLKNEKQQAILDTLLTLSHAFNFDLILDGVDNEALQQLGQQKKVLIGLGKQFKPRSEIKLPQKPTLVLHKFG